MDSSCICHTDPHNDSGKSLIAAFADFEGGELCSFVPRGEHLIRVNLAGAKSVRSPDGSLLKDGDMVHSKHDKF
jgi:hypothetical protein